MTERRVSGRIRAPATYDLDKLLDLGSDAEEERYTSEEELPQVKDESSSEEEFALSKSTQKKPVKKQKKGRRAKKQSTACHLASLPFELVSMILSEVHPSALYYLALSSKQFYALLSSEAARSIWRSSRQAHVYKYRDNYPNLLPEQLEDHGIHGEQWKDEAGVDWRVVTYPDPYDLSELQFAHLCFSKVCWICQEPAAKASAMWAIGIRCCQNCRRMNLVSHNDLQQLGRNFLALLPCLPFVLKDGASSEPRHQSVTHRRYWNSQVENLRLRLYDVKRSKSIEGHINVVPYQMTDPIEAEDMEPPSSPLSEISADDAAMPVLDSAVDGKKGRVDTFSRWEQEFLEHETKRAKRLRTFAQICACVESGLEVEKSEQRVMNIKQAEDHKAAYKQSYIQHAAAVHGVDEAVLATAVNRADTWTMMSSVRTTLAQRRPFDTKHYSTGQQHWMRDRLVQLAQAKEDYTSWHEPTFVLLRRYIVQCEDYKSMMKDIDNADVCMNEANVWSLPALQSLAKSYVGQPVKSAEFEVVFHLIKDEVRDQMADFCSDIHSDFIQLVQQGRQATGTNAGQASEEVDDFDLRAAHTVFKCTRCFNEAGNYPAALNHACVTSTEDEPVPDLDSWSRPRPRCARRARVWKNDVLKYDVRRSRSYLALWTALGNEDMLEDIGTCSDILAMREAVFTCNFTCDITSGLGYAFAKGRTDVSANDMLNHLDSWTHTGDVLCSAMRIFESDEEESESDDYFYGGRRGYY